MYPEMLCIVTCKNAIIYVLKKGNVISYTKVTLHKGSDI